MNTSNYFNRFIPILGLNSSYIKFKIKILKKLYTPKLCNDWWMCLYFEKQINIDKHQVDLALASKEAESMIKRRVEEKAKLLEEYVKRFKDKRCMTTVNLRQSKT